MTVRMWEVRAAGAPEADVLVSWLLQVGIPAVQRQPGYQRAEVFRGADSRVVAVTWWAGETGELPGPPLELLARPPHAWDFESAGPRPT
jgi:hypothetical protein